MSLSSPFISVFLILTFWGTILILSDYILPGGRDFECITTLLLRNKLPQNLALQNNIYYVTQFLWARNMGSPGSSFLNKFQSSC